MAQKKNIPPKKIASKVAPVQTNNNYTVYALLAAAVIITLICFSNAFKNDFTNWDDVQYVTENSLIKSLSWQNIKTIFSTLSVMGNYHPLAVLSLALDYHSHQLDPHSFHSTSIIIHCCNVALVFLFVQLLVQQPWVAFITALLFGIHPMHVESVAWIAERKDVLYVFFYMASLIAYLFYIKDEKRKILYLALTIVFFVLSLLSKAQAVTLPVVLLLIDYFKGRKFEIKTIREKISPVATAALVGFIAAIFISIWFVVKNKLTGNISVDIVSVHGSISGISFFNIVIFLFIILFGVWIFAMNMFKTKGVSVVILEKVPLVAIAFLMGLIAVAAQKETGAIKDIPNNPLFDRILFAGYSFMDYTWKLIVPGSLSAYYPYPDAPYSAIYYVAPIIALGLIAFVITKMKNRTITFGSAFYVANIFLLLQLLPVGGAMMAERYSYLCSIGLFFMAGKGLIDLSENYKLKPYKYVFIAAAIGYGGYLFRESHERNKIWNNSGALWQNVVSQYKRVPIAYNNLGSYYQKHESLDSALMYFNEAIRLKSTFPEALTNRSDIFRVKGNYQMAVADCDTAIKEDPGYVEAHMNRGIAYCHLNKYDDALRDFNFVAARKSGDPSLYMNRGNLYDMKGKIDSAYSDYSMVIQLDPNNADAYASRGRADVERSKFKEGLDDINTAISMHASSPVAYYFRSKANAGVGNYSAALQDAMTAKNSGFQIDDAYISELKKRAEGNK